LRARNYIVCTKCMRVFNKKRLMEQQQGRRLVCPYCGNTNFSDNFGNIIAIFDPEKSAIAKKLNKNERGIFALTVEV